MKKVLIYSNRRYDEKVWDISTPELENRAFLQLFKLLQDFEVYDQDELSITAKDLYALADSGNAFAAKKLLRLRKGNEYEEWNIVDVY
jgi:hypothetical protein